MAQQFYTILTDIGAAAMANALSLGTTVQITHLAVGDSYGVYYNPTSAQLALVHEVWRGAVQSLNVDPLNPQWLDIVADIPPSVGGFSVMEVGVFDASGNMIAVGKFPETYKPLVTDGSAKDLYIKVVLQVSNTAVVTLQINPAMVLATQDSVNQGLATKETPTGAQAKATAALTAAATYTDTKATEHMAAADPHTQYALDTAFDEHKADYAHQFASDTGVVNAYAVTRDPVPTSLKIGQMLQFIATHANTGASTLNDSSLGIKAIKKNVTTALASGDILLNQLVTVVYDGANYQLIPMNPPVIVEASTTVKGIVQLATSTDVLNGTDAQKVITPVNAKYLQASFNPGELNLYHGTYLSANFTNAFYLPKASFRLGRGGTIRVKFTLSNNGAYVSNGLIYKNNSPVGTERSCPGYSALEFSEDIGGWAAGDYVNIYCKSPNEGQVSLTDFKISLASVELIVT